MKKSFLILMLFLCGTLASAQTKVSVDERFELTGIVWTKQWITLPESEAYSQQDDAFSKAELKEYLRLLNKFYKDTKFHRFYTVHRTFYDTIENNMRRIVAQIDTAWFTDFFGQPFAMTVPFELIFETK